MSASVIVTAIAYGVAAIRDASSLSAPRTASRINCRGEASRPVTRINANGNSPSATLKLRDQQSPFCRRKLQQISAKPLDRGPACGHRSHRAS
jgi:hypothetical protein